MWRGVDWTDQSIRHDDLGAGHAEASDYYHDKLTHHPRRRLQVVIRVDEWERWKRCSEPCERHDPLVQDGREPSLPRRQRTKRVNAARD